MDRAEERALKCYPSLTDPFDRSKRLVYRNGYHQAEKDLGWHSVDERLPEIDEEVIVLTDEYGVAPYYKISIGHIVNKERCLDYNGWNIPGVRFWMPLPEIPKEEKHEGSC